MSSEIGCFHLDYDPYYSHREYKHDFPEKPTHPKKRTWLDEAQRVTLVALPFLSLHKPLSLPIALTMGTVRIWTCLTQLVEVAPKGDVKETLCSLLQTAIAVIALAGTIFAHPLGMVVTTCHDLAMEVHRLVQHIRTKEYEKAMGSCLAILTNALYLAMLLDGSIELTIASLAMQILVGLYQSQAEFRHGNLLEGVAHLAMGVIRTKQLAAQVAVLKATARGKESQFPRTMAEARQYIEDFMKKHGLPENATIFFDPSTHKITVIWVGHENMKAFRKKYPESIYSPMRRIKFEFFENKSIIFETVSLGRKSWERRGPHEFDVQEGTVTPKDDLLEIRVVRSFQAAYSDENIRRYG